ncbi:SMI1/KNR4 family protein [Aduncisulcus paluster]|uniref:SMI1/KNR4 family protein n=1 Tax=Aduncisulcus paluster TaxID=2918883 RepID=A0ABQ5JQ92_9EUKA|nr:SMI1/KNR4 family protein [Aduncisulcus paluster]
MAIFFSDFSFDGFWKPSSKDSGDISLSDELIKRTEAQLGFRLPASYIEFMKLHNGGIPIRDCFYLDDIDLSFFTETARQISRFYLEAPFTVGTFFGINDSKSNSLVPKNKYLIHESRYPATGVYISESFMLDYEGCQIGEEPRVVYVYYLLYFCHKIAVAKTFGEFVRKLKPPKLP